MRETRLSAGRRTERLLAIVGALAIVFAIYGAFAHAPNWFSAATPPAQPKEPAHLSVDGASKRVKFSVHAAGAPARGPEYWFYVLTDGGVVCDVSDDKGGTTRYRSTITAAQSKVLQRVISRTDFMRLPTDLTATDVICPPFYTFDIYFWDDTRAHVIRHYEGDRSRPEVAMLEDAIWEAFALDQWVKMPDAQRPR